MLREQCGLAKVQGYHRGLAELAPAPFLLVASRDRVQSGAPRQLPRVRAHFTHIA